MPKKALPPKQAKVDNGHQCFSVVAQARAKILPRLAQGSCQVKELDRTTKAIAPMKADWKVETACWVQCANMWQDCSLTAVQRNTAFVEQSWWAWIWHVWINAIVFVPMAEAPRGWRKTDLSYDSLNLIHRFTIHGQQIHPYSKGNQEW